MNPIDIVMWDVIVEDKELSDDGVYFYDLNGVLLDGTPFKKTKNVSVIKN